jgi:hypothetical protein
MQIANQKHQQPIENPKQQKSQKKIRKQHGLARKTGTQMDAVRQLPRTQKKILRVDTRILTKAKIMK